MMKYIKLDRLDSKAGLRAVRAEYVTLREGW